MKVKKVIKTLYRKTLILIHGKFTKRSLRCNSRTNPECACGQLLVRERTRLYDRSFPIIFHNIATIEFPEFIDDVILQEKLDITFPLVEEGEGAGQNNYSIMINFGNLQQPFFANNISEADIKTHLLQLPNHYLFVEIKKDDKIIFDLITSNINNKC